MIYESLPLSLGWCEVGFDREDMEGTKEYLTKGR